ncbi:MAG: thioredoxin family protein [Candidatus Micrarchaeia archaeon]
MVNLKYAMAVIIMVNLFFITLSVIDYMDMQRLLRFTNDLSSFSTETADLESAVSLLRTGPQNAEYCTIIDSAYQQKITKTNDLMDRMLAYERANLFAEFFALKRQFLLSNIQLWQVSQMQKQYCNATHTDVLYIYSSDPSCSECQVQGKILDSVRASCPNMRTFVMDIKESMATLDMIRMEYNITSAPSLVVNGKTHGKVLSADEIKKLVSCQ